MNSLMRIYLFVLLSFTLFEKAMAQSRLKAGVSFLYAPSTLLNRTEEDTDADLYFRFRPVNSLGGQLDLSYPINSSLSANLSGGYRQRGARFEDTESDPLPYYRLNYLDLSIGTSYHFKQIQKLQPFISLALTGHQLIKAFLKNGYEAIDIKENIKANDLGINLSAGIEMKIKEKHTLRYSLFYGQGTQNIFTGIYSKNGLKAYNTTFGINIGYMFGSAQKSASDQPSSTKTEGTDHL